jgi:hypothetical protein
VDTRNIKTKPSDIDTRHAALGLAIESFKTTYHGAKPPRPSTVLETAKLFDAYITEGKMIDNAAE